MSQNIQSARCAENERVEDLLDMLQHYGNNMYKRCDGKVFLFITDATLPLTDHECSLVDVFLYRLTPLKRASVMEVRIDGFGPYINLHKGQFRLINHLPVIASIFSQKVCNTFSALSVSVIYS